MGIRYFFLCFERSLPVLSIIGSAPPPHPSLISLGDSKEMSDLNNHSRNCTVSCN